ncbi:MAG TPA: 3-hydroxyacyl-CoA dehydrogenase NAD-binding domain-containing protein, partial [Gemmatimonadales bacterium]|nr:3-hydroxyacyl-CoA dehydrogenase NAD-binding domain-containing protein [Gemmatimonadales bacterium]
MTIPRKVAVIGAGDIGVGWAALCASAGWSVAIYDMNPSALDRASDQIERRTQALVELDRAPQGIVDRGLRELVRAKFLTEALQEADWVIEAISEDVVAKQKLLAGVEQAVA